MPSLKGLVTEWREEALQASQDEATTTWGVAPGYGEFGLRPTTKKGLMVVFYTARCRKTDRSPLAQRDFSKNA